MKQIILTQEIQTNLLKKLLEIRQDVEQSAEGTDYLYNITLVGILVGFRLALEYIPGFIQLIDEQIQSEEGSTTV